MSNFHLNNSVISSRTRSRSSSISSVNSIVEETSKVAHLASVTATTSPNAPNGSNMTSALVKSFQVIGATNTWENIRNDIRKLSSSVLQCEERISRIEKKLDRILEKLDASSQVETPVIRTDDTSFALGGPMYNELSVGNFSYKAYYYLFSL
jgi:hypothetical protein